MSIDIIDIRSPSKEKSLKRASSIMKAAMSENNTRNVTMKAPERTRMSCSTQLKQVTVDITRNLTHYKKV